MFFYFFFGLSYLAISQSGTFHWSCPPSRSVSSILTGDQSEKIGGRMPFSCLMFDDTGLRGPSLAAGQTFGFGLAVTSFLFQVPRRRSPSAATGRHLPFGPAVKCWHAQRRIGFHYFHSYEGATVDSDRAITQPLPPPEHFPITLKLGLVLQWKQTYSDATLWSFIILPIKCFMLRPALYLRGLLQRSRASHNVAAVNQISFQ